MWLIVVALRHNHAFRLVLLHPPHQKSELRVLNRLQLTLLLVLRHVCIRGCFEAPQAGKRRPPNLLRSVVWGPKPIEAAPVPWTGLHGLTCDRIILSVRHRQEATEVAASQSAQAHAVLAMSFPHVGAL